MPLGTLTNTCSIATPAATSAIRRFKLCGLEHRRYAFVVEPHVMRLCIIMYDSASSTIWIISFMST